MIFRSNRREFALQTPTTLMKASKKEIDFSRKTGLAPSQRVLRSTVSQRRLNLVGMQRGEKHIKRLALYRLAIKYTLLSSCIQQGGRRCFLRSTFSRRDVTWKVLLNSGARVHGCTREAVLNMDVNTAVPVEGLCVDALSQSHSREKTSSRKYLLPALPCR